jgi:predicted regulator of Ras-like GTPase activity (Roadblock/LC7/MglB family)
VEEIPALPSKTEWTPEEIVQRVMKMPGISGALVAATDGFLLAGQMPAPLRAETMAAFLPQLFKRVGDCAEAAQLGTLRALKLWTGQAPCAMFKAGGLYLAVLGQPGESLPEAALERIAGDMPQEKP